MPDLTIISTAISTIKTSMDIAKAIKDSNNSLNESERNLKVLDLIEKLYDVRDELSELQNLLRNKDNEIRELKEKINEKEFLTFDGKLYWKDGDKVPFCPICWEKDSSQIHLKFNKYFSGNNGGMITLPSDDENYSCRVCKNKYY